MATSEDLHRLNKILTSKAHRLPDEDGGFLHDMVSEHPTAFEVEQAATANRVIIRLQRLDGRDDEMEMGVALLLLRIYRHSPCHLRLPSLEPFVYAVQTVMQCMRRLLHGAYVHCIRRTTLTK
jgi:hypothetical protein